MKRIIISALVSGKSAPTPEILRALREFSEIESQSGSSEAMPRAGESPEQPESSEPEDQSVNDAEQRFIPASSVLQSLLAAGMTLSPASARVANR